MVIGLFWLLEVSSPWILLMPRTRTKSIFLCFVHHWKRRAARARARRLTVAAVGRAWSARPLGNVLLTNDDHVESISTIARSVSSHWLYLVSRPRRSYRFFSVLDYLYHHYPDDLWYPCGLNWTIICWFHLQNLLSVDFLIGARYVEESCLNA